MNTVLFVNATIGFSENHIIVVFKVPFYYEFCLTDLIFHSHIPLECSHIPLECSHIPLEAAVKGQKITP